MRPPFRRHLAAALLPLALVAWAHPPPDGARAIDRESLPDAPDRNIPPDAPDRNIPPDAPDRDATERDALPDAPERDGLPEATRRDALPGAPRDSDRDGLSDATERATGTDPLAADTDADGIADGREDRNRDGKVDPGETDPRHPGLFPGTFPHLPEPMVFDLVRGLGARAGELEVNTLVLGTVRRGQVHVHWAPEVEYAFARHHAVEIELPLRDRELMALKVALQGTVPQVARNLVQGWQIIAEAPLDEPAADLALLHLIGGRLGRSLSLFTMTGARARAGQQGLDNAEVLLNPSVFHDPREDVTVGIETNIAVPVTGDDVTVRVVPQLHWQIARHVRVQLGGGLEASGGALHALWGTRLILE